MTKCCKVGCTAEATHLPRILIPAMGYAIGTHPPMEATLGMPCCEPHARDYPLDDAGRASLQAYLEPLNKAAGKVQPDASRAWVDSVPLNYMSRGAKLQ